VRLESGVVHEAQSVWRRARCVERTALYAKRIYLVPDGVSVDGDVDIAAPARDL
jgi:hypothetical protein